MLWRPAGRLERARQASSGSYDPARENQAVGRLDAGSLLSGPTRVATAVPTPDGARCRGSPRRSQSPEDHGGIRACVGRGSKSGLQESLTHPELMGIFHLDGAAGGTKPWTGPDRGVRETTGGSFGMPATASCASPASFGDWRRLNHRESRLEGSVAGSRSMLRARCQATDRSRSALRAAETDDRPVFPAARADLSALE